MRSIRDHEAHLHRNGTRVVKFFLHVSNEEQRKRFLDRIDHPDKNWKFSLGDVEERGYWDDYMRAYEQALSATSTTDSPWYVDSRRRQEERAAADLAGGEPDAGVAGPDVSEARQARGWRNSRRRAGCWRIALQGLQPRCTASAIFSGDPSSPAKPRR